MAIKSVGLISEGTPARTAGASHAIGNYIVDFVSLKQKLIIELDGSQHLEQEEYDNERTRYFQSLGYKVIRFWNNAVMDDINGVICEIELTLLGK